MLHWVCKTETVNCGRATIYCDNATALKEVFATPRKTNNPFKQLQSDIDLITCARDPLLQLSTHIEVKKEWVKGHYTGPNPKLKHQLNKMADHPAGSFNANTRNPNKHQPLLPPMYEAELEHNNALVTSWLQHIVTTSLHTEPLLRHITKSAGWLPSVCDKIDWEAYKRAFHRHSRVHRISLMKLAHGLWHTNRQAHKMYGTTDQCPCCKEAEETLAHVFTCLSPDVVQKRNAQRIILQTKLERIRTPTKIQHAILDGIQQWESATNSLTHVIQAPYSGTVLPTDCILVQAFLEQSNEIGWDHLLRDRLSLKWSKAYQFYCTKPHQELVSATPWATQLIMHLWEYSFELWKF
jgi:hypothetical protein